MLSCPCRTFTRCAAPYAYRFAQQNTCLSAGERRRPAGTWTEAAGDRVRTGQAVRRDCDGSMQTQSNSVTGSDHAFEYKNMPIERLPGCDVPTWAARFRRLRMLRSRFESRQRRFGCLGVPEGDRRPTFPLPAAMAWRGPARSPRHPTQDQEHVPHRLLSPPGGGSPNMLASPRMCGTFPVHAWSVRVSLASHHHRVRRPPSPTRAKRPAPHGSFSWPAQVFVFL